MVTDEARRLHGILDGLLALASAETPKPLGTGDDEGGCNLVAVVADRVEFWTAVAADRGAKLRAGDQIGDARGRVLISESNLSQILDVLIDNATRHAGDHPTIVVTTRSVPDGGQVEVEVADDGAGIPEGDLTKVLQRFYTTGSGSGLGLSIVDVLVRGSGGRLKLGTSAAGGLSARILLDRVADAAPSEDPE